MSEEKIELKWNANRVLFGLSRIGYSTHAAIADIVDNSISYGGKNVRIEIIQKDVGLSDRRRNNIREYLIIDDGNGMDSNRMRNALDLGAPQTYGDESLSKFGLGLKSASFSLGDRLEIISSDGSNGYEKICVDLEEISDNYFCTKEPLTDDDKTIISEKICSDSGTIIRVTKIHENNHPAPKNTIDELEYRLGTIYYYFLKDGVSITLNENKIEAYDVLFTEEAEQHDNLNEHEWDGRHVAWIKKPESQTLDIRSADGDDDDISAVIEVTQLPHPPSFSIDGDGEQAKTREKYNISAGNYGYYVYRNKRLISWAERFDGLIPRDQDFYAFRGRILIDDKADDFFNIDVKKSHLELSEEANKVLNDISDEYKRKSHKAWNRAKAEKKRLEGSDINIISNQLVEDFGDIEDGDIDPLLSPSEEKLIKGREEDYKKKVAKKVKENAKKFKEAESEETPTDEDIESYTTNNSSSDKRIFRVNHIADNLLYEPYYDDDHGISVRINTNHRLSKLIFEDHAHNSALNIFFEIYLLNCVVAEKNTIARTSDLTPDKLEEIMLDFRSGVSETLVRLLRADKIRLPE